MSAQNTASLVLLCHGMSEGVNRKALVFRPFVLVFENCVGNQ